MKILITGAHFTPAVATIEELKKFKDVGIVYIGRKNTLEGDDSPSPESKIFPSLGIKFIPIQTGRLQRVFTIYTIPSLLKIPIGFLQSLFILLKEKPDVILSFGGYPAVPVVLAGWLFSVPVIIHEQALKMGLANKISSYFADKIAVSFKDTCKGEKIILTGNPIRKEILSANRIYRRKGLPKILVMGGNQGAHAINTAINNCLDKLQIIATITHVTGDNKYRDFENLSARQNAGYKVYKWLGGQYPEILQKSDLVICRAGINTLTELSIVGKPVLTIPIPFGEEQKNNAKYFENLGLVKILCQNDLSGKKLFLIVKKMLKNLTTLIIDAKNAKKAIVQDGAKRLALETVLFLNENKK